MRVPRMSFGVVGVIAVVAFLMIFTSAADAQHKDFGENQVAIGSKPASNSRQVTRYVSTHSPAICSGLTTVQRQHLKIVEAAEIEAASSRSRSVVVTRQRTVQASSQRCQCGCGHRHCRCSK